MQLRVFMLYLLIHLKLNGSSVMWLVDYEYCYCCLFLSPQLANWLFCGLSPFSADKKDNVTLQQAKPEASVRDKCQWCRTRFRPKTGETKSLWAF